jgi:hypothetical protein
MSCRKTVCRECATEWDGVNYCVACLRRQREAAATRPTVLGYVGVVLASAVLFALGVRLMVWCAALLAVLL